MAFTETQKVSVRRYLSQPLGYYQYNTQFESMFDKIGAVPEEQAAVESLLTQLDQVAADIYAARSSPRGALKAVDEVQWWAPKDSAVVVYGLIETGHMLVMQLAKIWGDDVVASVKRRGDFFSAGGSVSISMGIG